MLLLLTAALAFPQKPPSDWKFVDESVRAGRSVVTSRTVELADAPTRPLHPDDKPAAGSKYGSVGVGPGSRHRLGVVWHAGTSTLWFDANADGRFSAAERHTLADKPVQAKIVVPFGDTAKQNRMVMFRKRGDGVAWAVRGYTIGTVPIGDKTVAAMLVDGDADGCFDGAGTDRIWLDLDGDGTFDPLTEQFPLGNAISAGNTPILIRPRTDGLGVQARLRPNEAGILRVDIPRLPRSEVIELSANYVSEFGELVVVKSADKPVALPAGKYRVDSLQMKLADVDGKVWCYSFSSGDRSTYSVDVTKGKEASQRPLDGLRVTVSFDAGPGVLPGGSVHVQPDVLAGGLYLTRCEVGTKFAEHGREVVAEIKLTEPGSMTLDRCESGFH